MFPHRSTGARRARAIAKGYVPGVVFRHVAPHWRSAHLLLYELVIWQGSASYLKQILACNFEPTAGTSWQVGFLFLGRFQHY
jgi:hypothetical protein